MGAGPSASPQVPGSTNRSQENLLLKRCHIASPSFTPATHHVPPPAPGGTRSSLLHKSKFHCPSVHHPPPQSMPPPALATPGIGAHRQGHSVPRAEGTSQGGLLAPGTRATLILRNLWAQPSYKQPFTPTTKTPKAANLPQLIVRKSREIFSVLLACNQKYLKA